MSAPNADGPNQSTLGSIGNSVANAGNAVKETVMGKSEEAKKESGKEQAKGNVPGKDSLGDRVSGAADAVSGKVNQEKHETSADANRKAI